MVTAPLIAAASGFMLLGNAHMFLRLNLKMKDLKQTTCESILK
jgi:hypothetical protein